MGAGTLDVCMTDTDLDPDDVTTYNVTIGTTITDDEQLAIAHAVNQLREAWIHDILEVETHGGGDQQYGVSLLIATVEPAAVFDRYAETVEEVPMEYGCAT